MNAFWKTSTGRVCFFFQIDREIEFLTSLNEVQLRLRKLSKIKCNFDGKNGNFLKKQSRKSYKCEECKDIGRSKKIKNLRKKISTLKRAFG